MNDEKLTHALGRLEPARLPTETRDRLRRDMRDALDEDRPPFPPCPAPKPPVRTKLRILKRLAAALLIVGVVLAGSFVAVGAVAGARLTDEIGRIRTSGEPLTLEELLPPPMADEDNAAIPLMRALELLDESAGSRTPDSLHAVLRDPFAASEEAIAAVEAWIAANPETRSLLDEALARPGCRFPIVGASFENEVAIPYFDLVEAARLIAAEARLALLRGEEQDTLDGATKLLALGRLTGCLPFLIGVLVRTTIDGLAVDTVRQAMDRVPLSHPGYPEVLQALGRVDMRAAARWSMLSERAFVHARYEEFRRSPDRRAEYLNVEDDVLLRIPVRWIPDGVIRLDHARTLEIFRRMIDLAGQPACDARTAWVELDRESEELPWYAVLSRSHGTFDLSSILESFSWHQARVDLARIALALRLHEADHGRLPPTLAEISETLLPVAPTDPFSGSPYRYRPDAEGSFLLYGVDRNGRDDGGDDHEDCVWRGAAPK